MIVICFLGMLWLILCLFNVYLMCLGWIRMISWNWKIFVLF